MGHVSTRQEWPTEEFWTPGMWLGGTRVTVRPLITTSSACSISCHKTGLPDMSDLGFYPHPNLVCPLSSMSLLLEIRSRAVMVSSQAPQTCVVPEGSLIFRSLANWVGWRGRRGSQPHPLLWVWFMQPCWLCCQCQTLVRTSSISQQLRIFPEQNEGGRW